MPFGREVLADLLKLIGDEADFQEFRYNIQRPVVDVLLSFTDRPDPPKVWDFKLLRSLVIKLNDKFLEMKG